MGKVNYKQKFRKEWLTHADLKDWLEEKKSADGSVSEPKCKYCYKALNSKLSDLLDHGKTKKHKENCNIESKTRAKIDKVFPKETFDEENVQKTVAACLFIAQHCSIRTSDHLSKFLRDVYKQEISCGRTKCTKIIQNVLQPYFTEDLLEDVQNGYYTLLLDESTDISTVSFLGAAIVYFSFNEKRLVYTYLCLKPLKQKNADGIFEALMEILSTYKLDIKKLRAIGFDHANVMVAAYNSLFTRIKSKNPNVLLIKCACHGLQLSVSKSCSECLPRNLEFLLNESYNWFSKSSVRKSKYSDLHKTLTGDLPLKMVRQGDTRWLSIERCVSRILEQWNILNIHFNKASTEEKCYTASILYSMYNDGVNKFWLLFLQPILIECQKLNKIFQTNDTCLSLNLFNELTGVVKVWISRITLPNMQILTRKVYDTKIEDLRKTLNPKPYLDHQAEKQLSQLKLPPEVEKGLRDRSTDFLLHLITEFQTRFPDNIEILECLNLFLPHRALRQMKPTIAPLLELLGYSALEITIIENQWNSLSLRLWSDEAKKDVLKFWLEVSNYEDAASVNPFGELSLFVFSILILPHSNAEVERVFSQMNLLKSKLRNRMLLPTLDALLTIKYALRRKQKCCHNYKISKKYLKLVCKSKELYAKPNSGEEQEETTITDINTLIEELSDDENCSDCL